MGEGGRTRWRGVQRGGKERRVGGDELLLGSSVWAEGRREMGERPPVCCKRVVVGSVERGGRVKREGS
jgi:hypothetical protein